MNRLRIAGLIVSVLFILTSLFQHEEYFHLFLAYSILLAGWVAGGDAE